MADELKQGAGAEPRSMVRFTEWKVEGDPSSELVCNRYLTVTTDGVQAPPEVTRSVRIPHPDIVGADIEAVVRVCSRFGFSVASLVDECRRAEYSRIAKAWHHRLVEEDKASGE